MKIRIPIIRTYGCQNKTKLQNTKLNNKSQADSAKI